MPMTCDLLNRPWSVDPPSFGAMEALEVLLLQQNLGSAPGRFKVSF